MASINFIICDFISKEWIQPWLDQKRSQRSFADKCNVEEGIVRKIRGKTEYRIPVETLEKICDGQGISLHTFFKKLGK